MSELPQNNFIWSLHTKNGASGWRNESCTEKDTFELKVHIFSYKIFHLWSKIRNFQYCLDFVTTTLLQADKPTMVMLGEEMQLMHCNYGSKICCFDPIHQCKPDPNILSHNLTLKLAILEVFLSNKTWNSWLFTLKITSLGLISNI